MKTYIVLIPIEDNRDARKQCEVIENRIFQTPNPNGINIRNKVIAELEEHNDGEYDLTTIEVEPITDFMNRVNDEEFNVDNYFMSYVYGISFNN
jgi:hypothetical protein